MIKKGLKYNELKERILNSSNIIHPELYFKIQNSKNQLNKENV